MTEKSSENNIWYLMPFILPVIILALIGFCLLYKANVIFPPVPPSNISETRDWDSSELNRLYHYLGCNKMPSFYVGSNTKEMKDYCNILLHNLNRAYMKEDAEDFNKTYKERFEKEIK